MRNTHFSYIALTALCGTLLTNCSYKKTEVTQPPQNMTVIAPAAGTSSYDLIDRGGYRSGTVEWDASGRGHVYDRDGNVTAVISPSR